jgi:predicted nucleotidyltransferase
LPPNAVVYLHGSRVDRNARGGDIDLLVHVPGLRDEDELRLAARLTDAIERALGERKVDILLTATLDDSAPPFVAVALRKAVQLHP